MSRRVAPRSSIAPPPAQIPQATSGAPPIPPYAGPDIVTTINASGNVSADDGAPTTIDVVPDMRFHLLSWIYSIQHGITSSDYQASPYASPASTLGYTLVMMTALLYFGDSVQRHAMSTAAQGIFNVNHFAQFFDILLDLPVPAYADHEFSTLRPFLHPLALNLMFIPNLALSEFLIDFGRHFPAAIFFQLHNLQASLPANASPALVLRRFYRLIVADVTFDNGATRVNVTPSMYFGLYHPDNANPNRVYLNWLNMAINRIVTSQAIRPVFTAPTIGPLPLNPVAFADNASYNPYLYLSGLNNDNVPAMLSAMRSLGSFIKGLFPSSQPLRSYTQLGNEAITRHLIFDYPIPTWTTNGTLVPEASFPDQDVPTYSTHATFGRLINFATAPADPTTIPDGVNDFYNARQLAERDPPTQFGINRHFVEANPPPANTPDPISWVTGRSDNNPHGRDFTQPNCVIFDPYVGTTTHLGPVITSGIIIEEYSVSGAILPFQRPDSLLFSTNAHHINGAVPFSRISDAVIDANTFMFRPVDPPLWPALPQGFTFGRLGPLIFPILRRGIVQTDITTGMTRATMQVLPGTVISRHNRFIGAALNYFGFNLGTQGENAFPKIRLWSSYRYESQTHGTPIRYMLPSIRPIFGSQSRTFGSQHPATRIP
jgi:hypothetical protein